MKRVFVVLLVVFFFSGCAAVRESGFYDHSAQYKSWDHMKFSLWGFEKMSPADVKKSQEEGWWGILVQAP
jgi:uncharacterized protein YceK